MNFIKRFFCKHHSVELKASAPYDELNNPYIQKFCTACNKDMPITLTDREQIKQEFYRRIIQKKLAVTQTITTTAE